MDESYMDVDEMPSTNKPAMINIVKVANENTITKIVTGNGYCKIN